MNSWAGSERFRWATKTRETQEAALASRKALKATGDLQGVLEEWTEESLLLAEARGFLVSPSDPLLPELCRALNDAAILAAQDRLKRLADRVRLDLADPGFMAAKAGVAQESSLLANGKIGSDRLIWAEAWYDLSRDPAVVPLLAPNRPLSVRSFGGNWTLFFGAALP